MAYDFKATEKNGRIYGRKKALSMRKTTTLFLSFTVL